MSFLSKLEIENNTYNILECEYEFRQSIDSTGKPQGIPQGGNIHLKIESNGKTNFLEWMLSHSETKDGKIIFYRRDALSKLQELGFSKAYCVFFRETFESTNQDPLQIELELVCKEFDLNGVQYHKKWKNI